MQTLSNWKSLNFAVWERVTELFTTQSRILTTLKQRAFENIVGKEENAGNQHFLLFPQCFQLYQRKKSLF